MRATPAIKERYTMTVLDTLKTTLDSAVDSLSTVAQAFVEKNRTKAKLNRLRMIMKNESELMNRAYIALGKEYYEFLKKGDAVPTEKQQKLLEVIDKCKAKIAKARTCYREILESEDEFAFASPSDKKEVKSEDVVDITVACSNESDYNSNPFSQAKETAAETVAEVKDKAADAIDEAKENISEKVEEVKEGVAEKVSDVKEAAADKKDAVVKKAKSAKSRARKAVKEAVDEEFPEDELF